MKNRIIITFFAVLAIICIFTIPSFAFELSNDEILQLEEVKNYNECDSKGDADEDGQLTASDARFILRVSVHLDEIDTSSFMKADMDGDGKITASDARAALRLVVGLDEMPEHNVIEMVVVPATCKTDGLTVKICTSCVKIYAKITVPASSDKHIKGPWVTVKEANCIQKGLGQMKCLACSAVLKEEVIPETKSHSGEWIYPDGKSCLEPVKKNRTCTVCGFYEEAVQNPPGGHDFYWETLVENTCTAGGIDVYKCNYCSLVSKEIETKAHGHLYERNLVVKEPTCTEAGTKADQCVYCENITNEKDIAAKGHDFDNAHYKVTTEPTCTQKGIATVSCIDCGATREIELDTIDHTISEQWQTVKAANCTESGLEKGICRYCGEVTRDVPTLGHTVAGWFVVREATCKQPGLKVGACSVCNNDAAEEEIPALPHDYDTSVIYHLSGVLCKEDGVGYVKCKNCDATKEGIIKCLGKCDAGSETKVITAATCSKEETVISLCKYCKKEMPETVRPNPGTKVPHTFGEWAETKPATCNEYAILERECSVCAFVETSTKPALGHKLSDWTITINPTCDEFGEKTRNCSECDRVDKEAIPALGHDLGQWAQVKYPTCTENGENQKSCSRCDYKETAVIVALGHDIGQWVQTKAPDCENEGEDTRTCSRCDYKETMAIDALGHTKGDWEVTVVATCTVKGESVRRCTVCGTTVESKTSDALPHTPVKAIIASSGEQATDGNYIVKTQYVCSVCSTVTGEGEPIVRVKVDSELKVNFTNNCDPASGGAMEFEIENPANKKLIVRVLCGENGNSQNFEATKNGDVYSFTIPAELSEEDTLELLILSY